MERNYKHIKLKGESCTLNAIAMGVPCHDVAISIKINIKIRQSEVIGEKLRFNKLIKEWFNESSKLKPEHFICTIDVPSGYNHDRVMPMVFRVDIAVATRKEIPAGSYGFQEMMTEELERLVDML